MNPDDFQTIRTLLGSPEGQKLRDYLAAEVTKLRLIDSVKKAEHPYAQAVQFTGQEIAYRTLAAIMLRIGVLTGDIPTGRDPKDSFNM